MDHPTATRITPRDEAQIAFYFRAQDRFERSTSGPMLERADRLGHDSEGKRIEPARDDWNWRPEEKSAKRAPTWLRSRATNASAPRLSSRIDDDPNDDPADRKDATLLARETRAAGGYEVDHAAMVAFAQASRRMLAVERLNLRAKFALEAYYGDRGARWAVFSQDETNARAGRSVGPGSIAALYMLTAEGAKLLAGERGARKSNATHLTDDDLLANVFALQAVQPNAAKRVKLEKVRDAAEALLQSAWSIWMKTAPARRERRVA